MRSVATSVAFALVLAFIGASAAQAADTWYPSAKIVRLGVDEKGDVLVKLKAEGLDANGAWFRVTVNPEASLAILLTALSTGRTLKVYATPPADAGSYYGVIKVLYINV